MDSHDIDMAQDWLNRMRRECSLLLLRVANDDIEPDMAARLKEYFIEPVPVCPITSEVKNFLATVYVTDMRVFIGRRDLQNRLIERLLHVVQLIKKHEWSIYAEETNEVVSTSAA